MDQTESYKTIYQTLVYSMCLHPWQIVNLTSSAETYSYTERSEYLTKDRSREGSRQKLMEGMQNKKLDRVNFY